MPGACRCILCLAKQPASIKGRFLRGAIALAANGIPIFNPQNNGARSRKRSRTRISGAVIAVAPDDYHYHAAPLHLQSVWAGPCHCLALDGLP